MFRSFNLHQKLVKQPVDPRAVEEGAEPVEVGLVALVNGAAAEEHEAPVVGGHGEGVLVVGCEDEVGEVVDADDVLALFLVAQRAVGDDVLEGVGVVDEALDLVDLWMRE